MLFFYGYGKIGRRDDTKTRGGRGLRVASNSFLPKRNFAQVIFFAPFFSGKERGAKKAAERAPFGEAPPSGFFPLGLSPPPHGVASNFKVRRLAYRIGTKKCFS